MLLPPHNSMSLTYHAVFTNCRKSWLYKISSKSIQWFPIKNILTYGFFHAHCAKNMLMGGEGILVAIICDPLEDSQPQLGLWHEDRNHCPNIYHVSITMSNWLGDHRSFSLNHARRQPDHERNHSVHLMWGWGCVELVNNHNLWLKAAFTPDSSNTHYTLLIFLLLWHINTDITELKTWAEQNCWNLPVKETHCK